MSSTSINAVSSTSPIAAFEPNLSLPQLSPDEFNNTINQIISDGLKNHYSKEYMTDQIIELVKQNPDTAKEFHLDLSSNDIQSKIIEPYIHFLKMADSNNEIKGRIIFLGIGPSAFFGTMTPGEARQRGYGITGTLIGVGFDTDTRTFKLFRNSGEGNPNNSNIAGFCAGLGVSAGALYGSWNDFFGTAIEETSSSLFGITKITTPNGSQGWSIGAGDGIGACFSAMETVTKEIIIKP